MLSMEIKSITKPVATNQNHIQPFPRLLIPIDELMTSIAYNQCLATSTLFIQLANTWWICLGELVAEALPYNTPAAGINGLQCARAKHNGELFMAFAFTTSLNQPTEKAKVELIPVKKWIIMSTIALDI